MMRAEGSEDLPPGSPPASRMAAILSQCPMHTVFTGERMYCITSYTARPAYTRPPPDPMYMVMGASDSMSR
eukprot:CAMPEP_0119495790 /NCGR_PEP_ID=MMETSP1344-20130328/19313_1 /TAXON_ID=236787 /ORGANISM="Florenciella parvula, Strain CCMP2471" /LENGTH=70 /DNA_ID=CAMNT_0007531409 /DNA_START=377 /DNA_END=589 /DNA_ORIENTATION=-